MDASPFARLSSELRNTIYDFTFASDYAVTLQDSDIQHPLTKTCRQLRHETLAMYYTIVRFNAHLDDGPTTPVGRWMQSIGREQCLLLNEVNVWDLHMLNAIVHGSESTARHVSRGATDGGTYMLQPIGSWILDRGWFLKDIVIALYSIGLALEMICVVEHEGSAVPKATSHFAITQLNSPGIPRAEHLPRFAETLDLLAHLGFNKEMQDQVSHAFGSGTFSEREVRVRNGRRDFFLQFAGTNLTSIRQTFSPHDEEFVF